MAFILSLLLTCEGKTKARTKMESKEERNVVLLLMVGLINNQRMLIEGDSFVGWDIGFGILRTIDKYLKAQQSSWGKYVRNEYETNLVVCPKKF